MIRSIILTALLAASQHFYAHVAHSQQQQARPASTYLALEVTYYPGRPPAYQSVPGADSKASGSWYALFRRNPDWQPPAGSLPVRAVNILSRMEGDAIRVRVSVFLGAQFHDKEEPVATYLVRENEKVSVRELTEFGVEPFEIKAVRVTPMLTDPPTVRSNAESIVVIGVEANSSTLPSYKVSLQNLSGKDVLALQVEVFVNNQMRLSSMPQGREGQPLIVAGASHGLDVAIAKDARATPNGYEPETLPNQEVVITTAVFNDWTYEGDAMAAARYKAYTIGRKIQVERLLKLIQNALNSPEPSATAGMETFKAQVSSLRTDVDLSIIDKLLKEFPALAQSERANLKISVEVSSNIIKTDALKEIQKFEEDGARAPGANAYREWLSLNKERYEKLLSML